MNKKLLLILIASLSVVIILVSLTYFILKSKRSKKLKKRISQFTK